MSFLVEIKKITAQGLVQNMEMKNKVIDYIEDCGISVVYLSEVLDMDRDKFDKTSEKNWEAQELLEVCAFLNIDPMKFYKRKCQI